MLYKATMFGINFSLVITNITNELQAPSDHFIHTLCIAHRFAALKATVELSVPVVRIEKNQHIMRHE